MEKAIHINSLNLILCNATSLKNKTIELYKFLIDHNIDIAIIIEAWLWSTDIFKLSNYNIYRKDGSLSIANKPKGRVLLAVHKNIPAEDIPQPIFSKKIQRIHINKIENFINTHHRCRMHSLKTKINQTDLDNTIPLHGIGHFFFEVD